MEGPGPPVTNRLVDPALDLENEVSVREEKKMVRPYLSIFLYLFLFLFISPQHARREAGVTTAAPRLILLIYSLLPLSFFPFFFSFFLRFIPSSVCLILPIIRAHRNNCRLYLLLPTFIPFASFHDFTYLFLSIS